MNNKKILVGAVAAIACSSAFAGESISPNAAPNTASESEVKLSLTKGLQAKSANGNFTFKAGGRIQYDYNDVDGVYNANEGGRSDDEFFFRRVRAYIGGTIYQDWEYKIQYNISLDNAGNGGTSEDFYLRYKGFDNHAITVGQHKEHFGLQNLTSSKYVTAIERTDVIGAFAPGKSIGVSVQGHQGDVTYALGFFPKGKDGEENLDRAITGRVTFSPVHEDERVLHFGLAYTDRNESVSRNRQRPEVRIVDGSDRISSGSIGANGFDAYGLEFATVSGPFHAQAEYYMGSYERNGASDFDIDGYYGQVGLFLTNDSRPYKFKSGAFGGVKPKGKYGAVEVFARFSDLDLSDNGQGNGGETLTVGTNWYLTKNLRLALDYVHSDYDNAISGEDEGDAIAARIQFAI